MDWCWSEFRVNRHGVGAHYIVMEEVAGVCLGRRWKRFGNADEVRPILNSLLDMEAKFPRLRFSHVGSLYFQRR